MLSSELLTPHVGEVCTPPPVGACPGEVAHRRAIEHADETSSPVILGVKQRALKSRDESVCHLASLKCCALSCQTDILLRSPGLLQLSSAAPAYMWQLSRRVGGVAVCLLRRAKQDLG